MSSYFSAVSKGKERRFLSHERCCNEKNVSQTCIGLCKTKKGNSGNRIGIFGISNLGRCSKHMESIQNCRDKGINKTSICILHV